MTEPIIPKSKTIFLSKIYFITIAAFFLGNISTRSGVYHQFQLVKWFFFFTCLLFSLFYFLSNKKIIWCNFRIFLFILFCIITSYWSDSFERTAAFVIMFFFIYLISISLCNYFANNGIEKSFFEPIYRIAVYLILFTFLLYLLRFDIGRGTGDRISVWTDNPNTLGMMMYILLPIITYYLFYGNKKKSIVVLIFLMQLILLYKSGSRASLGAGLIGITIVFMSIRKLKVLKVVFIIIFIPFLAAIVAFSSLIGGDVLNIDSLNFLTRENKSLTSKIQYSVESGKNTHFDSVTDYKLTFLLSGRWEVWDQAFKAIEQKPFLGYGLGYEDQFLKNLKDEGKVFFHFGSNLHCSYMALILEVGYFGAFLALLFLISPIIGYCRLILSNRCKKEYYVVIAICLASLFNGLFESWVFRIGNLAVLIFWPAMIICMNAKKCNIIKYDER
jgi:O-antigen ligase